MSTADKPRPVEGIVGLTELDRACYADEAAERELASLREKLQKYRWVLMELRTRMHVSGRRPEECYEMSIIDDALNILPPNHSLHPTRRTAARRVE